MPPPQDAIKYLKTDPDEKDGYRTYTVYPKDDVFVFECWDCSLTNRDGSSVGTRKQYAEFKNQADAIAEYQKYVEAWEPDHRL